MKGLEKETKEERNGPLKDPYILFPHLSGEGSLLLSSFLPFFRRPGPQQQAPDRSGQYRTSRWQWAPPDLNSKRQMPMGTAGPQQQQPDCSGHYRT